MFSLLGRWKYYSKNKPFVTAYAFNLFLTKTICFDFSKLFSYKSSKMQLFSHFVIMNNNKTKITNLN